MPPALDAPTDNIVRSYRELRTAIGAIGMLLPLIVVVGRMLLQGPEILDSVSAYYYSVMGNVFVGALCAIGVFLWSYRGYTRLDSIAGNIAAIFALGVALFPTTPETGATSLQEQIAWVHIISAGGFFLTLSFFSLYLFRKTNPNGSMTNMKKIRNMVYVACGIVMLAAIAGSIAVFLAGLNHAPNHPVLWLEAIADFAFGVSWFVKGEAILSD